MELGVLHSLKFYNNAPDCADSLEGINYAQNPQNDATISGWACDGCDGAEPFMPNWDIERLELPHDNDWAANGSPSSPVSTCPPPPTREIVSCQTSLTSITALYKRDSPGYDLRDESGSWGECYRQGRDPHFLECTTGLETTQTYHMFICKF